MAKLLSDPATRLVLESLTWGVRVMTTLHLNRIAKARFDKTGTSILLRLVSTRLLDSTTAAVTYPEVLAPLYSWNPGWPRPRFNTIAWLLVKRWRDIPSRRLTLCWATEKAARLCGGTAEHPRHKSQVEHDLALASVFVHMHEACPDTADCWIGEDILRRGHALDPRLLAKIPDAAIVDDKHAVKFFELGGQYPVERVRRFHNHCRLHNIPYVFW